MGFLQDKKSDFYYKQAKEEKTLNEIKEHLSGKADVVLCDASPEFSGIKSMDMGLSLELNKAALEIAKDLLKIKGKFVCKTFRGVGFQEFIKDVKIHFIAVSIFKPKSSKSDSAEIYLIATGFRKAQLSKL